MKRKSIYSYYAFGYNYRLLRSMAVGDKIHGDDNSTLSRIGELFEKLEELDLQVTQNVASDLAELEDELGALPGDSKLDAALAKRGIAALDKLDPTLDAELQLRHAYLITPKRYDVQKLLERPGELLRNKVFEALSSRAQRDLSLACRCIAFSQPTAAAFHVLRATEETLRTLYCAHIKKNRMEIFLWGPMVGALRRKKTHKLKNELLDLLDSIRSNYRNPTQHPDKFYDIDEAQDLLNNCMSALNLMYAALPKKPDENDLPF